MVSELWSRRSRDVPTCSISIGEHLEWSVSFLRWFKTYSLGGWEVVTHTFGWYRFPICFVVCIFTIIYVWFLYGRGWLSGDWKKMYISETSGWMVVGWLRSGWLYFVVFRSGYMLWIVMMRVRLERWYFLGESNWLIQDSGNLEPDGPTHRFHVWNIYQHWP